MTSSLNIQYGSVTAGVGLLGLACYDLTVGDYAGAVQAVLAALASFGVLANQQQHEALRLKLARKGLTRDGDE